MINPFVTLAQKLSMLRHPDVAPTRILSLESMRKATVFLDNEDADADPARRELQQFFKPYGIEVRFLCPQKYELNWYGKMKKARPHKGEPPEDIDDDLFLSLAGPDNFAACGGCFPVFRQDGKAPCCHVLVSGLRHQEDHQVIADAMAWQLGKTIPSVTR